MYVNFTDSKEYQLQACYNNMIKLRNTCSDNLTEAVALDTISAIGEEIHKRGKKLENIFGYYEIKDK